LATPPAHPLQTIDRFVRSAPQLARALRWIAWVELVVAIILGLINFFQALSIIGIYPGGAFPIYTSLLGGVLQPFVFWGLLLGMALLLENRSGGRE
jgi:hypothetical protein